MRIYLLTVLIGIISSCQSVPDTTVSRYQFDDLGNQDRDGVINNRDICAQTPRYANVNDQGCTQWKTAETITFFNMEFGFDEDKLPEQSRPVLNDISNILLNNAQAHVVIIVDTSPEGSLRYNTEFAERRVLVGSLPVAS